MAMSAHAKRPLSPPQIEPSSPLSEVPSVLNSGPLGSSSPVSLVPDTPSRPPREDESDCDVATDLNDNDNKDDNSDNNDDDDVAASRTSRQEKLNAIIETLRRTKWTFEDMIEAWVGAHGPQDIRVQHRRYHKQEQRRSAMSRAMELLASSDICQEKSCEVRCASELKILITRAPFAKFTEGMTLESIDITHAVSVIKEVAPTWHALLQQLLVNRRQHRGSYSAQNKYSNIEKRLFAITSMVCFSRSQQTSNTLSSCLDAYFVGSGVHRRVIEMLHGFGLCHSYHHANSLMNRIAEVNNSISMECKAKTTANS